MCSDRMIYVQYFQQSKKKLCWCHKKLASEFVFVKLCIAIGK